MNYSFGTKVFSRIQIVLLLAICCSIDHLKKIHTGNDFTPRNFFFGASILEHFARKKIVEINRQGVILAVVHEENIFITLRFIFSTRSYTFYPYQLALLIACWGDCVIISAYFA